MSNRGTTMSDGTNPILSAHVKAGGKSVLFIGLTPQGLALFARNGAVTLNGDSMGMTGVTILLTPTAGPEEFKEKVTEALRSVNPKATVVEVVERSFDPKASS
jgi:hypothetical protein